MKRNRGSSVARSAYSSCIHAPSDWFGHTYVWAHAHEQHDCLSDHLKMRSAKTETKTENQAFLKHECMLGT